jgi:hypothetical protein
MRGTAMAALLKIALVPLVVWAASLAGRRWGHAVTGWISGLPLIAGPISLFLALGEGARFAAETAAVTLQATGAAALHCFVFAHAARRWRWPAALGAAWAAFLVGAAILGARPLPPLGGLAVAVSALAVALVLMPRAPRAIAPVPIPAVELAVRVIAATALAAAVMLGASVLGPLLSGLLLTFPITGSVLPAFTLALYGAAATAGLLAGFVSGLFAFAAFHAVVALALPTLGIAPAYGLAVGAALATTGVVMRIRRDRR